MGAATFQSLDIATPRGAAPIQADFVRAGQPEASNVILARSTDRSSYTMVWHCTAGAFEWTYDCDETIVILEGSVLLTDAGNAPRRLRAGDAVFFPKGAKVFWEIDASVRKLAIMHDQLPAPLSSFMKLLRRCRSMATALTSRLRAPSDPRPAVLAVACTTPPVRNGRRPDHRDSDVRATADAAACDMAGVASDQPRVILHA